MKQLHDTLGPVHCNIDTLYTEYDETLQTNTK
jgi:hypothetical protein